MSHGLIEKGVVAIAEAIARGEITSEKVTGDVLARLKSRGRRFNGTVLIEDERAINMARQADQVRAKGAALGLLHGVPVTTNFHSPYGSSTFKMPRSFVVPMT